MKIYISGSIAGDRNYREKFRRAYLMLTRMGHIPLNPAMLPSGLSNEEYMRIDLAMLGVADAVYALKDCEASNGAKLELDYARYAGKEIIFEGNERSEVLQ